MQDYFNDQAAGWYAYFSSNLHKKQGLVKGSLKLITSCYVSRTWAGATFIKPPSNETERIDLALRRLSKDEDVYEWEQHEIVSTGLGPSTQEMKRNKVLSDGQCVAIEVTAIKTKKRSLFDFDGAASSTFRSFVQSLSSIIHLPQASSARFRLRSDTRTSS